MVLRGPLEWQEKLCAVGDEVLREILVRMKDDDAPGARAEACLLEALREREMDATAVDAHLESDAEARFGAPVQAPGIRKEVLRGGLAREDEGSLSASRRSVRGIWSRENERNGA